MEFELGERSLKLKIKFMHVLIGFDSQNELWYYQMFDDDKSMFNMYFMKCWECWNAIWVLNAAGLQSAYFCILQVSR